MIIKLQENSKKPDYVQNLKKFLNMEDSNLKILKKSFGMLKGVIKKSPLELQKEMRKEWERKLDDAKIKK